MLWKDVTADNMQSGKKTDEATATEVPSYQRHQRPTIGTAYPTSTLGSSVQLS